MRLAIATTMRCNASCEHCCTSCGPQRTESLVLPELKRIIDQAADIGGCSPFQIDITGGEPFLDFDLLLEVTAYAASRGAFVTCMTNGYWAASAESAESRLRSLKLEGLRSLGVSTSRPHLRFVSLARVRQALEAARAVGLSTELKVAVLPGDHDDGALIEQCKQQLRADVISVFPVLPHRRAGAAPMPEQGYCGVPGLPDARCPGQVLMLEPGGAAYACCTAGSSNQFLALGDLGTRSLAQLDAGHRRQVKFRILRQEGPITFAREAIRQGHGSRLRANYSGPCDLCLHVATDSVLAETAEKLCLERELSGLRKAWNIDEELLSPIAASDNP